MTSDITAADANMVKSKQARKSAVKSGKIENEMLEDVGQI